MLIFHKGDGEIDKFEADKTKIKKQSRKSGQCLLNIKYGI